MIRITLPANGGGTSTPTVPYGETRLSVHVRSGGTFRFSTHAFHFYWDTTMAPADWAKLRPELWLFRRNHKTNGAKVRGFVHPTHSVEPAKHPGSNHLNGKHFLKKNSAGNVYLTRETEWTLPPMGRYVPFTFKPWQWFRRAVGGVYTPLAETNYSVLAQNTPLLDKVVLPYGVSEVRAAPRFKAGDPIEPYLLQKAWMKPFSLYFKLAIVGIPLNADTLGEQFPRILLAESEVLRVRPSVFNREFKSGEPENPVGPAFTQLVNTFFYVAIT